MSDGSAVTDAAATGQTTTTPAVTTPPAATTSAGSNADNSGAVAGAAGSDPVSTAVAGTTGTTETTPTPTASTDWRSGITDPELKEMASRFNSPADAVKAAADFRKANSSMTKVPGPNASPEDIAKFNKLIGVPETPTEYKFDLGREATEQDKIIQSKLSEIFLANRVPASASPAITKAVADLANEIKAEQDRVALAAREATTATLRKELGADYDSHVALAGRAVMQWGNPGFTDLLNKPVDGVKLGDHPDFVRVFGSIGRRMGEGGFIGAIGGTERQSLQSELNSIMDANPPGSAKYASPDIQRRVTQIHEALHGTGGGVGVGGRAV